MTAAGQATATGSLPLLDLADWLAASEDLVNTCGDPACTDYKDHAPDRRLALGPSAPLPAALAAKTGAGH